MQIRLFDETARLCSAAELFQRTGTGLTVLRTFRLLRILKLVRFLPALRHQLVVMLRTMDNVATFFALLCLFIFIFRFSPTSLSVSVLTDIPYAYRYFFHLDVQIWTSLNLRIFFIQFYTILDNFTYIFWNNTGTEGVILHFDKSIFLSIYFAPPPPRDTELISSPGLSWLRWNFTEFPTKQRNSNHLCLLQQVIANSSPLI